MQITRDTQFVKKQTIITICLCLLTTLEYFDLYLYIHLPFLNTLFLPKTDLHIQQLFFSALNYNAIFILRPLGALCWGYIGDHRGRQFAMIIANCMMILSSLIMSILPTYDQVGVVASYIANLCRVVQGFSSLGAVLGAQLYLTETTKPPLQYLIIGILNFFTGLGPLMALGVSQLIVTYNLNWRIAFLLSVGLTSLIMFLRKNLSTTPDLIGNHIPSTANTFKLKYIINIRIKRETLKRP